MDMGMVMDMEEKIKTRIVDIHAYLPVLIELVEQGKEVSLVVTGSSMSPFLCHQRDVIFFHRPQAPFKKGQMVFYQRPNGQYVMHRIARVGTDGLLDLIGDGQLEIEHGVDPTWIFGVVDQVKRKGKILQPGDFWWDFFARVWINMIPLRPLALKLYGLFKHKKTSV